MNDVKKIKEVFDDRITESFDTEYEVLLPGLNEDIVKEISRVKNEPEWMEAVRLKSLEIFKKKRDPQFGPTLEEIDYDKVVAYARPGAKKARSWDEVPDEIKEAFDKLGIPEAERKILAGVEAQLDSEVVYSHVKKVFDKLGIIFTDMDNAIKKYPDLVKDHFMRIVPPTDHKFAALHGALWSGGTFLYVPKGVKVPMPLQSFFMVNLPSMGQFEHTIIIVDEGAQATYIEGCSAPLYGVHNLHAGVVEVYVKRGAKLKYLTIQNWSKSVFNMETKRAIVEKDGTMEWISASFGSYKSMVYPSVILKGENSHANVISVSLTGKGQHIDAGTKVYHMAPRTTSTISSKGISMAGGWSVFRALLRISKGAKGAKASVECTSVMMDNESRSDTIPILEILEQDSDVGHEAKIGRISDEEIFYLMSRGLSEMEAKTLIIRGFMEPVIEELPLEYAIEINRLISMEVEGSVG